MLALVDADYVAAVAHINPLLSLGVAEVGDKFPSLSMA